MQRARLHARAGRRPADRRARRRRTRDHHRHLFTGARAFRQRQSGARGCHLLSARLAPPVRAFLAEPRFAVLGTIREDGTPQLTVIWYELQRDLLLFNTRVGREKERNIARDRRVSVCVEDGYRFVTLEGRVSKQVDDIAAARADILRLGVRYDGPVEARRQYDALWSRQLRITYHMTIEGVHTVGFDEPRLSVSGARDGDRAHRASRRRPG
jgi:PPOX class probable F420-dependent enzyme